MRGVTLRREAARLKAKAVASLRRGVQAFNDYGEEGRQSTVLLLFQHSFEMLLKAGLVQKRQPVFDQKAGRSISFEKCLRLGREHLGISEDEAGTLRVIDAWRDEEQHWMVHLSEGLLYLHCRAATTVFDDLLQRDFGDALANHLPHRVLPLSAEPPRDLQLLIDEEYGQLAQLLRPGKRKRQEVRARIRALLAMEAHVREEGIVSEKDVDRVERAVRGGSARDDVFPQLSEIEAVQMGGGISLTVRFVKKEGIPVRLVGADEEPGAGAIHEVDFEKKFHWAKTALAQKLCLPTGRCKALRWWLAIDDEAGRENYYHDFLGLPTLRQYSDNAYTRMRDAIGQGIDVDEVYRDYRASGYGRLPRPRQVLAESSTRAGSATTGAEPALRGTKSTGPSGAAVERSP